MKKMNGIMEYQLKLKKKGPADCITIGEVVAALKKMKRHKPPGLSGLSAEMIQATELSFYWIYERYCETRLHSRGF